MRHGQTAANLNEVLQGHLDTELTKLGLKQADAIARRLAKSNISHIYASDLKRAVDTAEAIRAHHLGLSLVKTPELRERSFGEKEGLSKKELGIEPNFIFSLFGESQEGETVKEMFQRAQNFIQDLKRKHSNDSVLLVCHGGVSYALVAAIQSLSFEQVAALPRFKNTNLSHYLISGDRVDIVCQNCTAHLEQA